MRTLHVLVSWAMTVLAMVLAGCGGGGDSPPPPPQVTQGPTAVSVEVGNPAAFSVTASGGEQMTYQWLRNGADIPTATQATYTLQAPTLHDSGVGFSVRVRSSSGTTTSAAAMLTVTAPPVSIASQPQDVTAYAGVAITLSVTAATSRGALTYQWLRNGVALAGGTSAALIIPVAAVADDGAVYTVKITSSLGAEATSSAATLTVVQPAITEAEIQTAPPTSIETLIKAHDTVLAQYPALLQSNPALYTRLLFEEAKRQTVTQKMQSAERDPHAVPLGLSDAVLNLTVAEWRVLLIEIPAIDIIQIARSYSPALSDSLKAFESCGPGGTDAAGIHTNDTRLDGVRHAYWNALMTKRSRLTTAQKFATAHEDGVTKNEAIAFARAAMDLHNNEVGRRLATKYPSATEAQLLELLLQLDFIYYDQGTPPPTNPDAIVYFKKASVSDWDGKLTGSITNPDSGGPWSMVMQLNQCGATLNGNIEIVRAGSKQNRRFTGAIKSANNVDVAINDPYVFENPDGLQYCTAMRAALNGGTTALSGSWTSANCRLGGVIAVTR